MSMHQYNNLTLLFQIFTCSQPWLQSPSKAFWAADQGCRWQTSCPRTTGRSPPSWWRRRWPCHPAWRWPSSCSCRRAPRSDLPWEAPHPARGTLWIIIFSSGETFALVALHGFIELSRSKLIILDDGRNFSGKLVQKEESQLFKKFNKAGNLFPH